MNEDKKAGLLYGSFCADALSLGLHWIYDTKELAQKHGRVNEYKAPGPDSYHPNKQAGEQGHVGDQALCLLRFPRRISFLLCSGLIPFRPFFFEGPFLEPFLH